MIPVTCPHCREKMEVPESLAGLGETCPTCGNLVPVNTPKQSVFITRDRPAGASKIEIICQNPQCGYKGPAWLKSDCDNSLGCLLMFFFLLPGILYFIIRGGEGHKHCECPKCGIRVR